MKTIKKVVLAYSGGLDTSCAVKWIHDTYGAEVICFSAFIGEVKDKKELVQRARSAGASEVYIENLKTDFVDEFITPALWARAKYEGHYFLATALGRPLIARRLAQIALREGADTVAHGCSAKGNDQVRIEVGVRSLAPQLRILAPLREWSFSSRAEEIEYAKKHNILIEATKERPYSIDKNLWGLSVEAGILEDPWVEPPVDTYFITRPPELAPKKPIYVTIDFKKGIPVALNGRPMSFTAVIEQLTDLGGKYGIGRLDLIENRLVGIKSREIYEAPQAEILHTAHEALESLVLDRELLHYKRLLSEKYSELVYYGLWFSRLRKALDEFFASYQNRVTGTVRLKLEAGRVNVVGRKSPFTLYSEGLATYSARDTFDKSSAEGFMKIWGLPYEGKAKSK